MILENFLTVKDMNGQDWQILVLDTFEIEEYPGRNYISYTFGEQSGSDAIKSYISIIKEDNETYSLEELVDEEEKEIVRQAYKNMLLESGEL